MTIPHGVRDDVFLILLRAAQRGRTVMYGSIMRACGIPRGQITHNGKAIGDVVGAISEWTWESWGVYLSSIVVDKNTGFPGGGFFGLTGIPSKLKRNPAQWAENKLSDEEKAFIKKCQIDVFMWARERQLSISVSGPKARAKAAS
jgi:hypothetical protein